MSAIRHSPLPLSLILSGALAVASGCANEADDEGGSGFGDDDAGPGDGSSEPPPDEGDECSITYQNAIYDGGEVTIYYIYLFPTGADELGPDLLGTSGVLLYGYQLQVTDIPAGTYDTIVVDEEDYFYVATEIDCDGNDWTWRITAEDVAGQLE